MCQEVSHENQEVQIFSLGRKDPLQQCRLRVTDYLESSLAKKTLEFLADRRLNVSQRHALQQGMPTSNGAANSTETVGLRKVIVPCIQHTLDH